MTSGFELSEYCKHYCSTKYGRTCCLSGYRLMKDFCAAFTSLFIDHCEFCRLCRDFCNDANYFSCTQIYYFMVFLCYVRIRKPIGLQNCTNNVPVLKTNLVFERKHGEHIYNVTLLSFRKSAIKCVC